MKIKALADRLAQKHGTRDPFQLADELGFILINTPLDGIRGFYQYVRRCKIIYIDDGLGDNERRWVCAHELGHALLHKGYNRIFMDSCTHMVSSRYESEADRFAADLLFADEDLQELIEYSIPTVAGILGISHELTTYRMGCMERCYYGH